MIGTSVTPVPLRIAPLVGATPPTKQRNDNPISPNRYLVDAGAGRLLSHILIVKLLVPVDKLYPVVILALVVAVPERQLSNSPPEVKVSPVIGAGFVPTPGTAKFGVKFGAGLFLNL